MATSGVESRDEVDVVVVGGGPVGENVAQYALEDTDLTAVIVEGELLGGECSYYACMPSKALLRPLEVAATAAHLRGLSAPALDRAALLARRDEWVAHYDDSGQAAWAEQAGIGLVRGHGRLAGERTVEVATAQGTRTLHARRAVVIATGSEAVVPDVLAPVLPWGSRDATGVVEVPDRLAIVGGGVVACEAATWMAALGSEVTLLVRGSRLLPREEPFAGELVLASLRESGVTVLLDTPVDAARREAPSATGLGRVHGGEVTVSTPSGEVRADELLVAAGRRPRLSDVGLASVGLTPDDVTRRGAALPDWLHAVGDASGDAQLTHWGKYQARLLGERVARAATGLSSVTPPHAVPVPQVVFTDPQVASVGATEAQARAQGHDVVVARVPFTSASGAALLRDDAHGDAQLVVDRAMGTVVGATFVGPDAGELLHAATIAVVGRLPISLLRHAVPSYPTASELWLRLLEALPRELRH